MDQENDVFNFSYEQLTRFYGKTHPGMQSDSQWRDLSRESKAGAVPIFLA